MFCFPFKLLLLFTFPNKGCFKQKVSRATKGALLSLTLGFSQGFVCVHQTQTARGDPRLKLWVHRVLLPLLLITSTDFTVPAWRFSLVLLCMDTLLYSTRLPGITRRAMGLFAPHWKAATTAQLHMQALLLQPPHLHKPSSKLSPAAFFSPHLQFSTAFSDLPSRSMSTAALGAAQP